MNSRSISHDFKFLLRQLVKTVIWSLPRYTQNKKNILLFCTRRGGSTLLTELIAANKGVAYVDHAFSIYRALSPYMFKYLPKRQDGVLASLDSETEQQLLSLTDGLLNGQIRHNAPWNIFKDEFNFRYDRVALKITACKPLIEWFDQKFDAKIVYFTRHPIPCALSAIRNNYSLTIDGYLCDKHFVDNYLNSALTEFIQEKLNKGTELEKHVVNWCMENLVPLEGIRKNKDWLFVTYEDLVSRSDKNLDVLELELNLSDRAAMSKVLSRSSKSSKSLSTKSTNEAIASNDRLNLISAWQKKVTDEQIHSVQLILDKFNVKIYQADSPHPIGSEV